MFCNSFPQLNKMSNIKHKMTNIVFFIEKENIIEIKYRLNLIVLTHVILSCQSLKVVFIVVRWLWLFKQFSMKGHTFSSRPEPLTFAIRGSHGKQSCALDNPYRIWFIKLRLPWMQQPKQILLHWVDFPKPTQ